MKLSRFAIAAPLLSLIIIGLGLTAGHATTAISTDGVYKYGASYTITIKGADLSDPATFSLSSIAHFILSTGAAQNPYTIQIVLNDPGTGSTGAGCGAGQCTAPTAIKVLGWGPGVVVYAGMGTAALPWIIMVNAAVQANQPCDTAPVFVSFMQGGADGDNVAILEAGVGGVCAPPGVPELPLSLVTMVASLAPVAFLLRRKIR